MAMTVKVGDVVKLNDTEWSYEGKHTAGHVGVVTAIHPMPDPFDNGQWVNIDGEVGAPFWNPVRNMSMLGDTGAILEDLDVQEGDVLVATVENEDESNELEVGKTYTAHANDCGCCFHAVDDDGNAFYHYDDDYWFLNLSALKREYQTVPELSAEPLPFPVFLDEAEVVELPAPVYPEYDDMDDAAKGALLLAAHEGKTIQFLSKMDGGWIDDGSFDPAENFAYRVKPQALIDAENAVTAAYDNVVSLRDAMDQMQARLDDAEVAHAAANDLVKSLEAA